jgi:hypothetical protein
MKEHSLENSIENTMDIRNHELAFNDKAQNYLRKSVKWAKIWAYTGFVMVGLCAIGIIRMLVTSNSHHSQISDLDFKFILSLLVVQFIMIGIVAFYLLKFSLNAQKAMKEENENQNALEKSMKYLFLFYFLLVVMFVIDIAIFIYFDAVNNTQL